MAPASLLFEQHFHHGSHDSFDLARPDPSVCSAITKPVLLDDSLHMTSRNEIFCTDPAYSDAIARCTLAKPNASEKYDPSASDNKTSEVSCAQWGKLLKKGTTLLRAFGATPESPYYMTPSIWSNAESSVLEAQGWAMSKSASPNEIAEGLWTTDDLFNIQMKLEPGYYTSVSSVNVWDTAHVQATGAYYTSCVNLENGLIIALDNMSPQNTERGHEAPIPSSFLQRWSDLVFLQWQYCVDEAWYNGWPTEGLKYILRYNIQNKETIETIRKAVARRQAEFDGNDMPPQWPGLLFDVTETTDGEEGRALLATPNGKGVAFMLLQHQEQLGNRRIKSVRVFTHTVNIGGWDEQKYMMLWNISDDQDLR